MQVEVLPPLSVTVQVTFVVPTLYEAEGWLFETEATPQLSDVTGVPSDALFTFAVQLFPFVFTVMLAGHVIVGAMLSTFVTLKVQLLLFPAVSVAVKVIVVVPVPETTVPAAGDCVTVIDPDEVQLSLTEESVV